MSENAQGTAPKQNRNIKISGEPFARVLRDALIQKGLVPPLGHESRDTYSWKFEINRMTGVGFECAVYRYKHEKEAQPYEAGDWRDEELDKND